MKNDYKIELYDYANNPDELAKFIIAIFCDEFGFKGVEKFFKETLPNRLKEIYNKFYIARHEGDIIGVCGFHQEKENCVKLDCFYVHSNYRNKKVGSLLYELCMNDIREKGYQKVILKTDNKFEAAIKFYEKNGYKVYKNEDENLWFELKLK